MSRGFAQFCEFRAAFVFALYGKRLSKKRAAESDGFVFVGVVLHLSSSLFLVMTYTLLLFYAFASVDLLIYFINVIPYDLFCLL